MFRILWKQHMGELNQRGGNKNKTRILKAGLELARGRSGRKTEFHKVQCINAHTGTKNHSYVGLK